MNLLSWNIIHEKIKYLDIHEMFQPHEMSTKGKLYCHSRLRNSEMIKLNGSFNKRQWDSAINVTFHAELTIISQKR